MESIITVTNASKAYGKTKAVDNLSFSVARGDFFGFLGPNGAGKTTTIRMLTGMLTPDTGEISIAGNGAATSALSKMIGVLPESKGFYEWMTGEEYLSFFADLYGIKEKKEITGRLLSEVGLLEKGRATIGTYSRGMKQRLALARALINNPQILFLDEPTLGLDPQGQDDVHTLLKKLNERGVTIFFSSHLLDEVSLLCKTVAIINKGTLVVQGSLGELRKQANNNDLRKIFLDLTR